MKPAAWNPLDPRPSQHTARSKEGRSPAWPEPRCAMRPPRAAHRRRSGAKASTPSPRDEPGSVPHREPHVTTDTHCNAATPRGGNRVGCARPPHGGEAPHLPPPACSRTPERFRARPGPDMARPGPFALLQASSARRLWRPARLLLNGPGPGPAGTRARRSRPAGRTGSHPSQHWKCTAGLEQDLSLNASPGPSGPGPLSQLSPIPLKQQPPSELQRLRLCLPLPLLKPPRLTPLKPPPQRHFHDLKAD